VVGESGNPELGREAGGLGAWVSDRAQPGFGYVRQVLVVLSPHDTGAYQGNT
jgi:hypothetical protein|tara:strand:- start:343 stop:498 length:156 start_codon:yes stop_codon:yes gene_type:complete